MTTRPGLAAHGPARHDLSHPIGTERIPMPPRAPRAPQDLPPPNATGSVPQPARAPWARHDLLHPTASGWAALVAHAPAAAAARVGHWRDAGLPVMRRRGQPGDPPGLVPVALAFPPTDRPSRLAFTLPPADVAASGPPPTLRAALPDLPDLVRRRAEAVLALADAAALTPRLFGSAMWQHVTGLAYLHDGSDLDLLWSLPRGPDPAASIARLLRSLGGLEARPGSRLDGEIVRHDDGAAVNWRELASDGPAELLVKTADAVAVMPRAWFLRPERTAC